MSLYSRIATYPDEVDELKADPSSSQPHTRSLRRLPLTRYTAALTLLVLSLGLNALLLGYNALEVLELRDSQCSCAANGSGNALLAAKNAIIPPYTPVQDAVTYEYKRFDRFTEASDYVPASDKADQLWSDLWEPWQMSSFPREQAAQLWNHTVRESGLGEPRYVAGLDVFHQLHCLDMIRKALNPERYGQYHHHHEEKRDSFAPPGEPGDPPFNHLDHCVNNIRESIMCNADLTPNVLQYDDKSHATWARLDVVHACVNWDSVINWALHNRPIKKGHTNTTVKVPDDWVWQQPLRGQKGW